MGMIITDTKVLVPGTAKGEVLKLDAPICFWGGLDARTSQIADPNHPQFGECIEGKVVAIPSITGSSSSSQYLMDLMMHGKPPRAILLGSEDIIIAMAVIVGRELGYPEFPILTCSVEELESGMFAVLDEAGAIRVGAVQAAPST